MSKYISELDVSLNEFDEERLRREHFTKINFDVFQGKGANRTFIWYKKGLEGITEIQLTYQSGLRYAGYTQIERNLNPDSSGDPIYLWYKKSHLLTDAPFVELAVTADPNEAASKRSSGWKRMTCDLTMRSSEPKVYLWMRRGVKRSDNDLNAPDDFGTEGISPIDWAVSYPPNRYGGFRPRPCMSGRPPSPIVSEQAPVTLRINYDLTGSL